MKALRSKRVGNPHSSQPQTINKQRKTKVKQRKTKKNKSKTKKNKEKQSLISNVGLETRTPGATQSAPSRRRRC
jgi:hypothetical protein